MLFLCLCFSKKTNPLNFGIDRDHVLENSKMGHHLSSIILGVSKCPSSSHLHAVITN